MASELSIISGAAVRLGEAPIISLDEDTKAVQAGVNLYDTILEATLSWHRWRFATGKIDLNLLAAEPLNEWNYAYQLPTNPKVVTIIKTHPRLNYERYEDKIYCNTNAGIAIDYVYRPDESMFPSYFVDMMEVRMASAMAIAVTGSRTLKQLMDDDLRGVGGQVGLIAIAMAADARERPNKGIVDSPYVDVRR